MQAFLIFLVFACALVTSLWAAPAAMPPLPIPAAAPVAGVAAEKKTPPLPVPVAAQNSAADALDLTEEPALPPPPAPPASLLRSFSARPALPVASRMGNDPAPGPEISVILSGNRFYPSEIRLRSGMYTTLVFATVNKKPGALVVAPLSGRWVASGTQNDRPENPSEITREINSERLTPISFEPSPGRFTFHDALGGARGEIIVE